MSIQVRVPALPESVNDATIATWHKSPGDPVQQDELLLDLETDKVVLEVPAPAAGVLGPILADTGAVVQADAVLATIEPGQVAAAPEQHHAASADKDDIVLTPAVRRLVKEHDLDPAQIPATGKGGRLQKSDVQRYLAAQAAPATETAVPATPSVSVEETTTISNARDEKRVPMSRLRARVAERLLEAQQNAAILTTFNEVDLQAVIELRKQYKDLFEKTHDVRLGFMPFFVKAVVAALQKFPVLNASVDGQDVLYHNYYDIGIAVGSPRGLVVPIVRDADQLSMAGLEQTIRQFGQKAKTGSLSFDELTGGTFTISNGGVYGSMLSTPILNPPQSGILGMHNIVERPMVVNGEIVIRPMMYLALSYDHRIIDGSDAVRFLVSVKEALEDPARLLLQV
ncbi:MAG: 2-oxoglutarate dehydrogenase complex dihydrolipoyllysine-residue succinyltransferase [Pseudomonadota bacterium]